MAADVNKHLDRAKRFLEKNRVADAITSYLAVLEEAPQHQEATQALGDLYSRTDQPDRAAVHYGMLFDLLIDPRDENKALALYNRFLRNGPVQQPPERIARYAFLQQKQNHGDEALEQYSQAAELFNLSARYEDELFCLERIAQLDPENPERQIRLAEAAERSSRNALAARAYLRAGQLASARSENASALNLLQRAYKLAPKERSVALLFADAKLRAGQALDAVGILEPFSATENDVTFVDTFSDVLMGAGQLDRAREVLERSLREKNEGAPRLFEIASAYALAGKDSKAVEILATLKRRMFADKKQNEFATQMDRVGEKHGQSQEILEFWGGLHNELNRESRYFEILIKLFDVYVQNGAIAKASEVLEKLVDIDAYDHRNQARLEQLRGKVNDTFFKRVAGRLARSATTVPRHDSQAGGVVTSSQPVTEAGRESQTLEDLIVQTEIFLQYALHNKALERLQKIATMFPGEEKRNARLSNLYQLANWWPPGAHRQVATPSNPQTATPATAATEAAQASGGAGKSGAYTPETMRDLSKIAEVSKKIFRQQTPGAMLKTAVNEVGTHLRATRALAMVGAAGRPPEISAEFCSTELQGISSAQIMSLLTLMESAVPDALGGLVVEEEDGPVLRELGLNNALGVIITDKESQSTGGMLIVGHAKTHKWRPNEAYFLQAVGDQTLMSVSHTRLRSLVRRMGVSDERTGLLSRSSYQNCLLLEADRALSQRTPLALAILQIDRGTEILRQQGESPMERYLEQLARSLQAILRQNDVAVKYTSWSLAFILPDTTLDGAQRLAEKLLREANGIRPPWDAMQITLSAGIVEAAVKTEYDSEDIVTDLINRAEFSVEEARKSGGDTMIALDTPKV
jgi:diguanylate cyclase (GGDEF)-like protein